MEVRLTDRSCVVPRWSVDCGTAKDGPTTNIWAIPTSGGPFRHLTGFGRLEILIARQVSWSPDGRTIYAAVAETDADIVLLDGITVNPAGPNSGADSDRIPR